MTDEACAWLSGDCLLEHEAWPATEGSQRRGCLPVVLGAVLATLAALGGFLALR
jgi:hypothetical protein